MSNPFLSIVVPCYNEEDVLLELYDRLTHVCKQLQESYEIILINDGSKDKTWQMMLELSNKNSHIVAVNLSRNFGHQLALSAGLKISTGERVFIIDADLQDPPELLAEMMIVMNKGIDVVYGKRIERQGETAFKKTSAFLFYRLLNNIVDINIPEDTGDFRLINRKAVNIINNMPEHHRFIRGMVSWIGLRQEAFPYNRASRFAGQTKYPMKKMIRFALDAVTGFSVKPLRIATYSGFIFGVLSLFSIVYILIQYFLGKNIAGWTSLTIIIMMLGSIQLFVIGVLGEYIGRLYIESKNRPLFIIQDIYKNK